MAKVDDLLLFLLILPQLDIFNFKKEAQEEQKNSYSKIMSKLNEGAITAKEALVTLIVKQRPVINESFRSLYNS